jgi:hypothetical protein
LNVALKRLTGLDIAHFTVHDMRRTARTNLARLGVDRFVAERALNHKLRNVEGVYDRHDYFEQRMDALSVWAATLVAAPTMAAPTIAGEKAITLPPADPAADILGRAVRLLAETKGEPWVNKGSVWHMIKRLDPTFDTKDHGHASFAEMVKALDSVVEVKKGDSDHILRLR